MKLLTRLDFLYGTEMGRQSSEILQDIEDDYVILGEAELAYVQKDFSLAEQLFVESAERNQLEDKYLSHCFNRLAQISIHNSKFIEAYKYTEASKSLVPNNPDTA